VTGVVTVLVVVDGERHGHKVTFPFFPEKLLESISPTFYEDLFKQFSFAKKIQSYTGGPRYMREIGTPKIGSHIMNLNIKRPKMIVN
jgi:hypothetical protein